MKKINFKKYSKAILEVGSENGIFDNLLSDLKTVSEKMNLNPDFKVYLSDPHLKMDEKEEALKTIFQDFISRKTLNLLLILIKDRKINFLDLIIAETEKLSREEESIVEALVESVVELSAAQQKEVSEIISEKTKKKVLIKNILNPDLIAGLKITLDSDTVFDASFIGKINKLNEKIKNL